MLLDEGEENIGAEEEGELVAHGCGREDGWWRGEDGESDLRATIEEGREVLSSSWDSGERGALVLDGAGVV